ncbi:hypothetical protein BJ170DRAFT_396129 [Xylariales sp. AK1849]|nr:hypothetical protein BJ170DRAFT_396129 [Xylariales sp. AK1849]
MEHDQYPYGLADVAGYWAEDFIFGGVVLFDRRKDDAKNVYLHSGRAWQISRIWKLTDDQMTKMISFLTSESPTVTESPLPLESDNVNWRTDDWDAWFIHHIFRDRWERKVPEKKDVSNVRWNTGDYPELNKMFDAVNSGPSHDVHQQLDGSPSAFTAVEPTSPFLPDRFGIDWDVNNLSSNRSSGPESGYEYQSSRSEIQSAHDGLSREADESELSPPFRKPSFPPTDKS